MANFNERKKSSLALRFIYIVALIFLCVGLCVLGSFRGTGNAYELKVQGTGDAETPTVVFQLNKSVKEKNDEGEEVTRYYGSCGKFGLFRFLFGRQTAGTHVLQLRVFRGGGR